MKLVLNRIGLFATETQKYIPLAMLTLTVLAMIIGVRTPEDGGGTGL